jgi:hypothetical protein
MNTQLAFAFGMLAMVAIIMIIVLVVGMVKVIRHEAGFRNIHNEINDCHRHISDTERHIYTDINEMKKHMDHYTSEFRSELLSYTDSRVDKLEQKLTIKPFLKD